MRRLVLALSVVALVAIADQANAQYRGGRGGGISIGIGTGGGYGGYGRGYYPGNYYGGGYNQGYYGNRGYYGGYPNYGYSSSYYGGYPGYYGGYGTGIGVRLGNNAALWFSPTGYNYIPWSARSSLYSPTTTVVVPQEYVVPRVIESTTTTGPTSNEWALKITKVMDGPAKKADLREGDVIMGVGQTRTQTLAELQQALATARGQVDIIFLNKETQKIEKVQVTPDNGKLGIEVFPVDVQ
jgi:hypothetical protein